ncbi:ABC-type multidrug transport system, ATPase and permease component [Actinacidiphila rubida]|uniref:ABC-type multidrug transport system, ATPase and permease component n=2 Tax=Actinacidiphila rubida TaxID=310780 RepID=A0A1H8MCE1_9ACTN|nr:ABC transporter ATP-binding protein [Actinacidiphila rubida]SEO15017.1 ABC-type multidrug transport system, ATPase and permease component [Actinacidiphila rubida]
MTTPLPVAGRDRVRRAALGEVAADKGAFTVMIALNVLAAAAGLVAPWLLGSIIDTVRKSTGSAAVHTVDRLALFIVAATVAQTLLSRYALYTGARFGERAAARVRERFAERTLALPAAVVEHAPAGDLAARGTADVDQVAATLRNVAPQMIVGGLRCLFIVVAVLLLDPLLGVCGLACLAVVSVALRWYLRRARSGYLAEGAASAELADTLATTVAGARTVEALRLRRQRIDASDAAIAETRRARLHTLWLRSVLFPSADMATTLPVVGVLAVGAVLYDRGSVGLGAVVAAAVYFQQLVEPLSAILWWVEQVQSSAARFARIEGLGAVTEPDGPAADGAGVPAARRPDGDRIVVSGVRYAYLGGADVLHGVDLDVRPGERLAVVGTSGAGKSTLGRLLAGVDRPRTGTVTVGGVPVADLPPERLRRQIVLVTQDHHVFHDTLRANLLLSRDGADDDELRAALDAVGAGAWAADLDAVPDLDGPQAQQLSLARVILADPHTLILDEATALLDPATARSTERALAAALRGRTVIAVAHRLQTAHDADRIAVMSGGTVTELGTHDALVAAGGTYAALWRSWHGG